MKKIWLFISIIGLFALAGCDTKNPTDESSNSNTTTDISPQNEPSESSGNTPSTSGDDNSTSTPSESKDNNSSTTTDGSKEDDKVYDDDLPWGPLH